MYEMSGSLERQQFYEFKWKEEEKEELEEEEEAGITVSPTHHLLTAFEYIIWSQLADG